MKKIFLHIALIILIFAAFPARAQYVLDNTGGKINNKGTIRVNGGQVRALNDTIGGRVEFLQGRAASQQAIPNIVYNQLVLRNDARKIILDERDANNNVRPLTVMDSLIISDNAHLTTRWTGLNPEDVIARSSVSNTARFDGARDLIMQNEISSQDLIGNGRFSRLKVDNPIGVNVRGGGFTIEEQLTLSRGTLRNSEEENFNIADSVLIERNVAASLAHTPIFEASVDVRYVGNGSVSSSGELPTNESSLQNLMQDNIGDLVLTRNVTVNDSLYVGGRIFTGDDTLTLATSKNPSFNVNNPNSEISGTIRLTNLRLDSTEMILHNPLTYALFRNELAAAGARELIVSVYPRTFPLHNFGTTKVMRSFEINAIDGEGEMIESGANMHFAYAWRNLPGDSLNESNNLAVNQLVLQKWTSTFWDDNSSSSLPVEYNDIGWASASATISSFGSFAIGITGGLLTINAKVFLEGAYRFGSMADDLRQRGYLTMPPPDVYPYNLDPYREFYVTAQLPDSVVDWVVVEFRQSFTDKGKMRTYLVKQDGRLVDIYGNDALILTGTGDDTNRIDSGNYYVAVRHRNHLALVTRDYVGLMPGVTREIDFTDPIIIMGGVASVKRIDKKNDGSFVYGMIAGNVNGSIFDSGKIDANDYNNIIPSLNLWSQQLFNGYLIGDINLDGIITTKDFNMSFNNRNRVSALP